MSSWWAQSMHTAGDLVLFDWLMGHLCRVMEATIEAGVGFTC